MEIPEGDEREKGKEEKFEIIMIENFTRLMSDTKPQIGEAQKTQSSINEEKYTEAYHFQTTEN